MQNTTIDARIQRITPPNPIDARVAAVRPASPASRAGVHHAVRPDAAPKKKSHAGIIALGVLGSIIVIAYGAGAYAFSNIYYPGTQISGIDISLMKKADAVAKVEAVADSYQLSISGNDFTWTYTPTSTDALIDSDARAQQILDQNEPFIWPVRLFEAVSGGSGTATAAALASDTQAELPENFDLNAFYAQVDQAVDAYNQGRSGTFDAASAYDESTGQFTLAKAKANVKVDKEKVRSIAKAAVANLVTSVSLTEDDFDKLAGNATDDQLQAAIDAANQLIGTNVTFKMAGNQVAALDGKTLAQWIVFSDDLKPSLNADQVTAWANDLAGKLNTVGSERTYTRPDGKQVTISGGTYGWSVDTASLVKTVENAVASKQTGDIDIPTKSTADKWTAAGQADWGAYIDVDLTEQHARFYDASGNIVWESGFISGNVNKGNGTPTGIYKINTNNGASTLIGKTDPATGEPEYKTPVNYWMPFEGNAVGFHDASWQSTANFSNPEAYKTVGSHGCINLPPEKAKELHDLIKVGLCVIVHS